MDTSREADTASDARDETGDRPGRDATPGIPRWVYGFAITLLVLVGLFVALHLAGFGLGGQGP